MQFLKEHGYGGVIIWSLDLDDKTGSVCNEGPFPIFNAAKRELLILPDHLRDNKKCSETNETVMREYLHSRMNQIQTSNQIFIVDFFVAFYLVFIVKFFL